MGKFPGIDAPNKNLNGCEKELDNYLYVQNGSVIYDNVTKQQIGNFNIDCENIPIHLSNYNLTCETTWACTHTSALREPYKHK